MPQARNNEQSRVTGFGNMAASGTCPDITTIVLKALIHLAVWSFQNSLYFSYPAHFSRYMRYTASRVLRHTTALGLQPVAFDTRTGTGAHTSRGGSS
jgi:hypothetical protein